MNSLIEVTQTVLFTPARLLAQVEYSTQGEPPSPVSIDFRTAHCAAADRGDVESVHQSRPTRLGQHHPDLQSLHLVQDCRPAMVVDPFDAHPVREFHNLYNSLHRFGQKLRQRRGLRNRPCLVGNYFLPDSRLRQRAISRTRRWGFDAGAASGVTDFAKARSCVRCPTKRWNVLSPTR